MRFLGAWLFAICLVAAIPQANAQVYLNVTNAGTTGTTQHKLAIWSGANALIAATSTTTGVIGVVDQSAGTTGSALIAIDGPVLCAFDGTNIAGNWAVISTTVAGDCHDSGTASTSAPPAGTIGVSTSGNTGAGNYQIKMGGAGSPSQAGGSGTVTSVTCNAGLSGGAITTTGTCTLNLGNANAWTAPQRTGTETPTISSTTFTPVFSTGQNHRIDFPATTCSCTIANPAAIVAGQSGVFELVQGATSASLNPTWGSEYEYAAGTSSIVLSTGLGAIDYIPYYVDSTGSFIVLGGIIKGPAH